MNRREFNSQIALYLTALLGAQRTFASSVSGKRDSDQFGSPLLLYTRLDYSENEPAVIPYGLKPNLPAGQGATALLVEVDFRTSNPTVRESVIPSLLDAHSVLFHRTQGTYICLPRVSTSGSVVDVRSMTERFRFSSSADNYFYGHGAIHPTTGLVYLSQTDSKGSGTISVREPEKLKELRTFSTFGYAPHDVHFIEENLLAVANNGWNEKTPNSIMPSSLCILDVKGKTPKLVRELKMTTPGVTVQHFATSKTSKDEVHYFLGLDAPWPKAQPPKDVSLLARSVNLNSVSFFESSLPVEFFHGNILSVAGHAPNGVVMTTTPQSGFCAWDAKQKKLHSVLKELENPMGVQVIHSSGDHTRFLATTTNSGIYFIDTKRMKNGELSISTSRVALPQKQTANIVGHASVLNQRS